MESKQRSWLGEIDYSSGEMTYLSSKDEQLRGSFPFFVKENCVEPLSTYMDQAKMTLMTVIAQYKHFQSKSMVDQTLLIPDEYKSLVWFLFPSEVLQDLLALSKKYHHNVLRSEAKKGLNKLNPLENFEELVREFASMKK